MTPVGLVKVRLGRARGRVLARVLASAADVAMVGHWGRTDVSRASEATARASAWAWSPPYRPALTAPHREVESGVNDASPVGLLQIADHQNLVARPRRRPELEFDYVALFWQDDLFDFVQRLDMHQRVMAGANKAGHLDDSAFIQAPSMTAGDRPRRGAWVAPCCVTRRWAWSTSAGWRTQFSAL